MHVLEPHRLPTPYRGTSLIRNASLQGYLAHKKRFPSGHGAAVASCTWTPLAVDAPLSLAGNAAVHLTLQVYISI